VIHSLEKFSDTDRIVKSIRGRDTVFVGLRGMKQKNMDDLKQSVTKIKRVCNEVSSNMSLVEEEWLLVTPLNASVY
jgi:SepF-like predicted cell division protein (DUF552 family)